MLIFQTTFVPVANASPWDDIFEKGDAFLKEGEEQQILKDEDGNTKKDAEGNDLTLIDSVVLKTSVDEVYNILFTLGVALSVIIGAALGIKFMVGTVEDQVKVKEMLVPYVIGCVVIFGAFGIWKFIVTIGTNVFT